MFFGSKNVAVDQFNETFKYIFPDCLDEVLLQLCVVLLGGRPPPGRGRAVGGLLAHKSSKEK